MLVLFLCWCLCLVVAFFCTFYFFLFVGTVVSVYVHVVVILSLLLLGIFLKSAWYRSLGLLKSLLGKVFIGLSRWRMGLSRCRVANWRRRGHSHSYSRSSSTSHSRSSSTDTTSSVVFTNRRRQWRRPSSNRNRMPALALGWNSSVVFLSLLLLGIFLKSAWYRSLGLLKSLLGKVFMGLSRWRVANWRRQCHSHSRSSSTSHSRSSSTDTTPSVGTWGEFMHMADRVVA